MSNRADLIRYAFASPAVATYSSLLRTTAIATPIEYAARPLPSRDWRRRLFAARTAFSSTIEMPADSS